MAPVGPQPSQQLQLARNRRGGQTALVLHWRQCCYHVWRGRAAYLQGRYVAAGDGSEMISRTLLTVDAVINLGLGILLFAFPTRLVSTLGVPGAEVAFYPSILGAVLFGIGIALLIERHRGSSGLGLMGAISINLCGGLVLAGWLLFGELPLPARGHVFLWALVAVLVGISGFELFVQTAKERERAA